MSISYHGGPHGKPIEITEIGLFVEKFPSRNFKRNRRD